MGLRLVFLDLDGVLNSHAYLYAQSKIGEPHYDSREPGEAGAIDPEPVKRLNRLIDATGAKVVVSSSWRHGRSVARLRELLGSRGFTGEVIGKTPDCVPNNDHMSARHVGARGDEIHAWIQSSPLYGVELIESFVILDDDDDMSLVADRLVLTSFDTGLTDAHVDRAIAMLTEPPPLIITPSPDALVRFT
jgi:hypothetical protein